MDRLAAPVPADGVDQRVHLAKPHERLCQKLLERGRIGEIYTAGENMVG
jgi:hypothetical protein